MNAPEATRRILELLRHRHTSPKLAKDEWATFTELRGSTGYVNDQRIDFFAIHTWPSKGYRSIAYEVKVSRSDFNKEIQSPLKRQFAESVSHESLFVVPAGLVQVDEVPEGWGLMVADAGGLKVLKHGTQRANVHWPVSFVVSLARRSADPPPALPAVAWKVAGQEVTEDQLIAVAESTLKTSLAREREIIEMEAKGKVLDGPDHKALMQLRKAVGDAIGEYGTRITAEAFGKWLAGAARMSPLTERKLKQAAAILSEVVEAKVHDLR